MKRLFKITLISLITMLFGLYGAPVFAGGSTSGSASQVCQGIGTVDPSGNGCSGTGGGDVNKIIGIAVNILTIIVGIAAVIMIIIAGFRLIVSGGESASVAGAKNAIIYVVIGIVVVVLAQVIVHFVLNGVAGA
jgi:hypothetical protein